MIAWKAKYGYVVDGSAPLTLTKSFIFTNDGLFSIGTTFVDVDGANMGYGSNQGLRFQGSSAIFNATESAQFQMGADFDITYSMSYPIPNGKATAKTLYPSPYLSGPDVPLNLNVELAIYIPGLKRVLIGQSDTSPCSIWSVDESGILTSMQGSAFYLSNYARARSMNCVGYKDYDSLKDVSKIRYFQVYVYGNSASYTDIRCGYTRADATSLLTQGIAALFSDFSPPDASNNPYAPGGESGEGGGDGTFDDDSDPIPMSSLPTLSSANTGFTRIYNPTLSQVQDLANYLWTDESVIQTIWNHIKQFFENPMDAIIGFNLVPVVVPNGGTESFKLMYIDTGVNMIVAANQFVDVDCGTLELKGYYGSALDYSPYTKVSCYLPYIGNVSLNVDEVMNCTLQVKYRVDICSGSCVAYILVNGNAIYQYSGHCAIPIPLSSADFSSYVNSAISVGKLAGAAMIAGAGALAATEAVDASQQTNQIVTTTKTTATSRNPSTGRQVTDWTKTTVETRDAPEDQSSTQASFAGLTPQNIANTVGQIMSSKPYIEHSGSFSGNSGYLGVRRPYLIIERPNMCMPANFQALNGFPSMITLVLGECSGFTRIQQVQLTGMTATNPEQAEILQLLKSGVIL